ncbi:tRNA threonylcarbamoyladenosine biosynthesis protein TsaE [Caprobacter fermentans]|uniref:tRNA threonylcarbamoyladenosine biosynthesis protein TsaE n=1 Tax=Caproicibacter fermentans TaxID=2576756 RepID=A0A6N8I1U5_9FIRM|nr:tRNA (adenosine(37)-N6)-threonylcarbamoyltransferase complex ATPase subunit type 1 TsaE [Caproicibacter fermentans]MVB11845.1 tRNA threonylcarbamoyladenosine biosynthesis protein TsaE [Caproicibacter fermentans]OCN00647.1 tRNA (N6-adenosine(37)-N6)-threonylcarbamoyltransferase complex ATPase TsaE [Clostridium sp. W14A]QNK41085.1 tRNA (adenosine(37)-N6)-threonylcarbamoyltransferase complex ATPase subunit type 1 TsaE [Caproicibacter fermentans]
MREYKTSSPEETERLGEQIASGLKGGEVLALFGGMGMGKTALTRGIARGLGIPEGVSSPTFALVHEYKGRVTLYHFDMYRVTSWDDLASTGFFDDLDSGAVLVVEWSENIENALPPEAVRIHLHRGETDGERVIAIEERTDENTGD